MEWLSSKVSGGSSNNSFIGREIELGNVNLHIKSEIAAGE